MVLTILHSPGFKPLSTCSYGEADLAPISLEAQHHIGALNPAWTMSHDRLWANSLPQAQPSGTTVQAWISSATFGGRLVQPSNDADALGSDSSRSNSSSFVDLNSSPLSRRSTDFDNSSIPFSLSPVNPSSHSSFTTLPSEIRAYIWTLHALHQTPRTVSTGSIIWLDGAPYDDNQPLPIHQINRETRAGKHSVHGLYGYRVLNLSVLTCTVPRSRGFASIPIHPALDMLHITNEYLSLHRAVLPSLYGLAIMQDLHLCNLLGSLQHLALCCHDVNFEFLISQLPHFERLETLFVVTGTHYVKVKKGESGERSRNRFDAEGEAKTVLYMPDAHSYLAGEFLRCIVKPWFVWREQVGVVVGSDEQASPDQFDRRCMRSSGSRKYGVEVQDRIILVSKKCQLPYLKVDSRVNWFEKQETLRRIRDRMERYVGGGSGHVVLSEARYERIRQGRETLDYFKRQIRGGKGKKKGVVGGIIDGEGSRKRKRI